MKFQVATVGQWVSWATLLASARMLSAFATTGLWFLDRRLDFINKTFFMRRVRRLISSTVLYSSNILATRMQFEFYEECES